MDAGVNGRGERAGESLARSNAHAGVAGGGDRHTAAVVERQDFEELYEVGAAENLDVRVAAGPRSGDDIDAAVLVPVAAAT